MIETNRTVKNEISGIKVPPVNQFRFVLMIDAKGLKEINLKITSDFGIG